MCVYIYIYIYIKRHTWGSNPIFSILSASSSTKYVSLLHTCVYICVRIYLCIHMYMYIHQERTWGSKPISSILSASSSTKYVTLCKLVCPRSKKSISLPGVAMQMSTPRRRSIACKMVYCIYINAYIYMHIYK